MEKTGLLNKQDALYLNESKIIPNPQDVYRKVYLYGTSIEAIGTLTAYITYTAKRLGIKLNVNVFNFGLGGGGITWYNHDVQITDQITAYKGHVYGAFSCTYQEKMDALAWYVAQGKMSPSDYEGKTDALNLCYDKSVLEHLDGDLYIFGTYGINDRMPWMKFGDNDEYSSYTVDDALAMDRRTIYGAYNYVLNALFTAKPNARVIILGQHTFNWNNTDKVNDIQRQVAEKWCIPFLDWGHHLGINDVNRSTYTDDGTHPNATGREMMGNWLGEWLLNNSIR